MNIEGVPISQFVALKFSLFKIQKIVESWRVEPKLIIEKLVEHFREMGIFTVYYGHDEIVINNMMFILKNSPDIQNIVQRANSDELKRQRTRHAE